MRPGYAREWPVTRAASRCLRSLFRAADPRERGKAGKGSSERSDDKGAWQTLPTVMPAVTSDVGLGSERPDQRPAMAVRGAGRCSGSRRTGISGQGWQVRERTAEPGREILHVYHSSRVRLATTQPPRGLREELCMEMICHLPPTFLRTLVATPSRSTSVPVFGSIVYRYVSVASATGPSKRTDTL